MSEQLLVRDVMTKAMTIAKSAKITEALDKMLAEALDPLIVTNNGDVVGTVSRKAIAEKLGAKRASNVAATAIHVANCLENDFTSVYPDQSVDILVPLLQHYKLVVVLDAEHRLLGQVGLGDLLRVMEPDCSIDDVLVPVYTIQADERVVHLRRRMLDDGISKFIVNDGDQLLGIVTETDVARSIVAFKEVVEEKHQDHRIRNLLVRDIMSAPLICAEHEDGISPLVELMQKKKISSLPVAERGRIIGMVTRESLVKAL